MFKHSRSVAAIAASSLLAVFAAQANKGAEYHASKHHEGKKFFITGGATYLEPSLNSLDYANVFSSFASDKPLSTAENLPPSFNWGYYVGAGYKISHHYDVQASWAQYDSTLSDSTSALGLPVGNTSFGSSNGFFGRLDDGELATAAARQTINYSVFDANLGQYHNLTEMLKARIFAGVRWAKVDAEMKNSYSLSGGRVSSLEFYDNYSSSYNGAGPEVGLDLEYKVYEGLGVVGHLAAAFLIGNLEANSDVYNSFFDKQYSVNTDSVTRLVPAVDAKLGANWSVPYHHDQFSFAIEAGYQVAYYWDVVDQVQFEIDAAMHNDANYGNMGPYLNLTAMF